MTEPVVHIPPFDPRTVPVVADGATEGWLPARPQRLTPHGLREHFGNPPAWAPELVAEKKFADRAPADAAVLLPLVMRDQLTLLLTRRTAHLSTHSGQIALPGGKVDATDADAVDAALREAEEEIGLPRGHVEVLGTLPVYVTGTAFFITPVVALVQPGFELRPNPDEVDDAAWVDWSLFRAGVLDGSREISPWCREQVELLPEDPLTAAGQPVSALPAAARVVR